MYGNTRFILTLCILLIILQFTYSYHYVLTFEYLQFGAIMSIANMNTIDILFSINSYSYLLAIYQE